MKRREIWRTRFGFYFVAMGTAFGLGNLWRFPYVVVENGGGAFVLLYISVVFLVGTPLLLSELLLGKSTRKSIVAALQLGTEEKLTDSPNGVRTSSTEVPRFFRWISPHVGRFVTFLCVIVLSYFAVISGWVFYFFVHFCLISLGVELVSPEILMANLRDSGGLQFLMAALHLLLVTVIVVRGVEEGTERWVGYMAPIFVSLLLVLVVKSLSLDTSREALRYFLYPDFSQLKYSSLGEALGHVFFTLSLGFGTMVTFGSYLRQGTVVSEAGVRVAVMDSGLSLFSGLLIFPLVFMGVSTVRGPELLFQTVPILLSHIQGGSWFGVGFFLCLYLSALGASIGLMESFVANLKDAVSVKRLSACIWGGLGCAVIAILPAFSSSLLSGVKWGERGLLEIFDKALINWALPIVALFVSQILYHKINDQKYFREFMSKERFGSPALYFHWLLTLRWIVPFVIILAFVLEIIGLWQSVNG